MDDLRAHLEFFEELGVEGARRDDVWRKRPAETPVEALEQPPPAPLEPLAPLEPSEPVMVPVFATPAEALVAIRSDLGDCTRCKLHRLGRKKIVFGVGNPNAD